jgi:putative intracellular protease/amidase
VRIAIAVFEGAEELDFVGPWEVLTAWRHLGYDVEVVLVGATTDPVVCAKGMQVIPDTTWTELGEVDVLVYRAAMGLVRISETKRFVRDCAACTNKGR